MRAASRWAAKPGINTERAVLAVLAYLALTMASVNDVLAETPASTAVETLEVRVNNYSRASSEVIRTAQRTAAGILEQSAVRLLWLACSANNEPAENGICDKPLRRNEIVMRVLAEPNGKQFADGVFGFAVVPLMASVYFEPAYRRAKSDAAEVEVSTILGCAMAHEIGHLLLGLNSHSSIGIMRATWGRNDIQQARRGLLVFTSDQATSLKMQLRARAQN